MKQTLFTILISITIVSCSTKYKMTNNDIVGKYQVEYNVVHPSCDTIPDIKVKELIELKENQTFLFSGQHTSDLYEFPSNDTSSGVWKRKGNKIILNSTHKIEDGGYKIIQSKLTNSDSITIKVVKNDSVLVGLELGIWYSGTYTVSDKYITNENGIVKIPKIEVDSMYIGSEYFSIIYYPNKVDYYEIEVTFPGWNYIYITNWVLTYKKKKHYFWCEYDKRKFIKLNNFQ